MLYYDTSGRMCLHAHSSKSINRYDVFPFTAEIEDVSLATRIIECVSGDGDNRVLHQMCFSHLNNEEVYSWERLGNFVLPWDPNRSPKNKGNFPNALVFHCDSPRIRALVNTCYFVVFVASRTNSSVRVPVRFRTPMPLLTHDDVPVDHQRFHLAASRYVYLLADLNFEHLRQLNELERDEVSTMRRLGGSPMCVPLYQPHYYETIGPVRWPWRALYDIDGRSLHPLGIDKVDGKPVCEVSAGNEVSGSFLQAGRIRVFKPIPPECVYAPGHALEAPSGDDSEDDIPIRDLVRNVLFTNPLVL